ncbi:MAG: hypothetical protein JW880_06290, partial [Candidatus Thermoplasmatota archaeon]|nr:hypothetical protein [Candidatus Thermoplasmatota archaeon]
MTLESLVSSIPEAMWSSARKGAEELRRCELVRVASHIDADGVAAAAIAKSALTRAHVRSEVEFFKKLDQAAVDSLRSRPSDALWLTDLGSGSLSKFEGAKAVVSDHHVPEPTASSAMRKGQALLTDFSSVVHINPHMHGISGANELSGAGATFLVAVAMDPGNV